ncbi:MAG: ABC transporter permease [Pseudomonadota bacterium]
MVVFFIQRIAQALIVMLVISVIGFAIADNLGDPLRELVGQSVSEAERDQLRDKLGLNDPFWVQYGRFLGRAVQGDLGTSYFFKKPALEVILNKFPATFELVLVSSLLIIFFCVPAGLYAGIFPSHFLSKILMLFSIVGISVPVFLTAIFLIYIFSVELGWMPSFGRGETVLLSFWEGRIKWTTGFLTLDGWRHLILPSIALSSIMLPLFMRLIRAEMMETLRTDYVRFAWAKGLSRRRVWLVHAFRNSLLPIVTVGGVQIGTLIAYTILTETVFQWPGMGFLFLEAVNRVDTPLIIAYIIIVGLIFVVINTLVDLTYHFINPVIRVSGRKN